MNLRLFHSVTLTEKVHVPVGEFSLNLLVLIVLYSSQHLAGFCFFILSKEKEKSMAFQHIQDIDKYKVLTEKNVQHTQVVIPRSVF